MLSLRSLILFPAVSLILLLSAGCDGSSMPESGDWRTEVERYRALGDYRSAAIEVKNALKAAPKDADMRALLGQLQIKQKDFAGAEKELKRALSLGASLESVAPSLANAYYYQRKWQELLDEVPASTVGEGSRAWVDLELKRAAAYTQLDQAKSAAKTYNAVLDAIPGNADALLGLGGLALAEPDLIRAESLLNAAMKAAPADPRVWQQIGKLRYQQHRYDDAILSYKRALKRNTAPEEVHIGLAWAYMANERLDMARKEAMTVRKRNVNHPMANYLLAALAFKEGDNRKAQDYLNFARKNGGHRAQTVLLAAANDQALGNYIQAESQLRDFLRENPDYLPAQAALAEVLHAQGRSKVAFEGLQRAARRLGGEEAVALDLAKLALKNNKPNEAKAYLAAAIASGDRRPELLAAKNKLDQGFMHRAAAILESMDDSPAQGPTGGDVEKTVDMERVAVALQLVRDGKLAEAESMALALVKDFPNSPEALNLLGSTQAGRDEFDAARQSFSRAAALQPNNPRAVSNTFVLEMGLKNYDTAGKLLDAELKKFPLDVDLLASRAQVAMLEGDNEASIRWLKKLLEIDPVAVSARINMTRLYLALGNAQAAKPVIDKAYRTSPGNPEVLELMAQVSEALGSKDSAGDYYQKLIELEPLRASAYEQLARLQLSWGDVPAATGTLKDLLEQAPTHQGAAKALVRLYLRDNNPAAAMDVAKALQQVLPGSTVGFALEADVLVSSGEHAQAEALYATVYERSPSLAVARALYQLRERGANSGDSMDALKKWVAANPVDVAGRVALGSAYLRAGQSRQALSELNAALEIDANNPVVLNNLASIESAAGNQREALGYAERGYRAAPKSPALADTLGWLLVKSGRSKDAIAPLQQAARGLPDNAEVNYHLGVALEAVGRKQDAVKHLQRALAGDEAFTGRDDAEAMLAKLAG